LTIKKAQESNLSTVLIFNQLHSIQITILNTYKI
jgi:hypothetical protein